MGAIYGWGTLHLSGRRQVSTEDLSFADPNCEARAPIKLQLPTRFVSICAGRNHSAALDVENRVWMIMQWGRPYLLTFTGSLDRSSRHPQIADKRIIQVACGHMPFVCFLTDDGKVYIIWATKGLFEHQATLKNEMLDRDGDGHPAKAINGAVLCTVIPISAEPVLLPSLPLDLPPLLSSSTDIDHEHQARTRPPKLIKITAGNNFVLGLTDQGHLLFINVNSEDTTNGLDNLRHWLNNGDRQWTYLPHFCDINHIIDDPVFTSRDNASNSSTIPIPSSIRITHISAYWKHFMAHTSGSPSIVLRAQLTAKANNVVEFSRTIQANFPNNEVMSVMTGCDHCVALSSDGIVRTWGKDERGTLGIGPQTEWKRELHTGDHRQGVVYEPTPVQFNHADPARRKFCFSITAAGWHAAALVFDMDEIMEDEEHHVGLVRTDHAMPLEGGSKQNTKGAIHRLKLQFNTAQRWKQMKRKMSLGTSEA
ncbi:hypothetical protein FRC02_009944 [Tulasnella sp. 418]|nr:hypothetical protein FRC02_009944 [Tulasnella sp. 418]